MPNFLSDPPLMSYLLIAAIAVGCGFFALRAPTRRGLNILAVPVALLVLLAACDLLVESPREEATRKMQEMADASRAGDINGIFRHVSESFDYKGVGKHQLRDIAQRVTTGGEFQGANVRNFERQAASVLPDGDVRIGFTVQGIGYSLPYYCEATFTTDPDGERRLKTFLFYNVLQRHNAPPEVIPGLG